MSYQEQGKQSGGPRKNHAVTMEGRRRLTVSGVEEVISFDEGEISLRTGEGSLTVRGEELNISQLNVENGNVEVEGHVTELVYDEIRPERGLWARLFR